MKFANVFVVALMIVVALGVACGKTESPQSTQPTAAPSAPAVPTAPIKISDAAVKEAETLFATRCMPCHGLGGKGDGPASKGLTPPPRDFTDHDWQSSVTDEHIEKIIQFGGAAVGKSPMMPPNPDLTAKKDVVAALRAHIRELGGQ